MVARLRIPLSVLHAFMSQSGSLGTNPFSLSAPSSVPDSVPPLRGVVGGDGGRQPHTMGGLTRASGVGAFEYTSPVPSPIVSSVQSVPCSVTARLDEVADNYGVLCDYRHSGLVPPPPPPPPPS